MNKTDMGSALRQLADDLDTVHNCLPEDVYMSINIQPPSGGGLSHERDLIVRKAMDTLARLWDTEATVTRYTNSVHYQTQTQIMGMEVAAFNTITDPDKSKEVERLRAENESLKRQLAQTQAELDINLGADCAYCGGRIKVRDSDAEWVHEDSGRPRCDDGRGHNIATPKHEIAK